MILKDTVLKSTHLKWNINFVIVSQGLANPAEEIILGIILNCVFLIMVILREFFFLFPNKWSRSESHKLQRKIL